jgi:hypothetical protein
MNVVKIGAVKVVLCLGAQINFCPYFPRVLSDLGEIRCERSARNAGAYL